MNDDVGSIYFGGGTPSILTETDLEKILNEIHKKFKISNHAEITIECNPDEIAIDAPFFGKNIQSMLKLGRAQGIAMAAGLSREIPITEYSPKKIKMAITGNGNASKEQVAKMLHE